MAKRTKRQPRKVKKVAPEEGIAHIKATFNNTKITVTDIQGNTVAWSSAAKVGFKGSRKSTPFAAQVAADAVAKDCKERFGLRHVHVKVKGPGPGRESAVRAIEIDYNYFDEDVPAYIFSCGDISQEKFLMRMKEYYEHNPEQF